MVAMNKDRDIDKYTKQYLNHNFEETMVYYRRKKVLETLKKHQPKNILEVGCGIQSIYDFYTDYETFTVVEPSDQFCEMIKKSKTIIQKSLLLMIFLKTKRKA